jgi:predicted ATPase
MDKLTLDGRLLRQKSQVQGQLLVSSHNERIARLVELGPTRAAKDLQDIEHAQVNE